MFKEAGFDVCRKEATVDDEARKNMENGFMVDEGFRDYNVDDLCVTGLKIALKAGRMEGMRI